MLTLKGAPMIGRWRTVSAREVMDHHRRSVPRVMVCTIDTSFLSATDTKACCYRATDLGTGEISYSAADWCLTTPENHLKAAMACIAEWRVADYELLHSGANRKGDGFLFTFCIAEVI